LAIVPTNAIAAGSFLVSDFPAAAMVYDRQEVTIEISREPWGQFREKYGHYLGRGTTRLGD
jgi:HK97 family phage major capsid protein